MSRNRRPRSIYSSLLGNFILISTVPLILMMVGTISILSSSLSRMSLAKNRDIVESMAEDLTIIMTSIESDIDDIRILRDFTFIDEWALRSYLDRKVKSSPAIDMIQIINGSSRVVSQAPYDESILGLDLSRHPVVLDSGGKEGFTWSQSFLSLSTGQPTVTVTHRYRGYSVIFYVNLTMLGATLVSEQPDAFGYAYILDRDGTYLAHPDPDQVYRRENERNDPAVLEMIESPDIQVYSVNRNRTIQVLRKMPQTGWIIGFRQPMNEIFPMIWIYNILAISVSLLAIGLAALLAFYRIRGVLSPLKKLMDATSAVSSGDYSVDLGYIPILEVSELSERFDSMVRSVHEREENLDRLVEERTLELQDSLEELRRAQDQLVLQERMAALGNMVSGVAHEINTPIGVGFTAITYLTDEIRNLRENNLLELTGDQWIEFLGTVEESSRIIQNGLSQAATQVKSFKQVAVDQAGAERRLFNLRDYIDDVISVLHPAWRGRKVEFDVDCPENLIIDSYPGAFSQILNNFVINSLNHAFDEGNGGTISINVRSENGRIFFVYQDDGKGMDEAVKAKVFDPFFTTRRNSGGSGLGMHIVYNLVTQLFDGTIVCESRPGEGTLFRIIFTLRDKGADE